MDVRVKKLARLSGFFLAGTLVLAMMLYFTFRSAKPKELSDLTSIQNYASSLPEFPAADDQDWENPQFSEFYKSRQPGFIAKTTQSLGIWKGPPWSVGFLANLIKEQTKLNHEKGLIDGDKNVIHIKAQTATRVLVFGDMYGSFHSLLRDLGYLRDSGVLNNDLKILNKNIFMIFNGNFIDRSPYSVDALILLMTLMKKNPEQVIYLAGNHEKNGHWTDYSFKQELVMRGRLLSEQPIPFNKEMLDFFASLPEAVYVSGIKYDSELIRISSFSRTKLAYSEALLNHSILEQSSQLKFYNLQEVKPAKGTVDVRAVIEAEEWRRSKRIKNGLGLLDQDRGATVWAVLSSPTLVNRSYLNFNQDAFVALDINEYVKDASLTCMHQNLAELKGFSVDPPLNIISGQAADLVRKASEIKIGSSMSMIRGVPATGKQLESGLSTSINEFNQSPQNTNKNIRLYIENDDYQPELSRKNFQELLSLGVRFFVIPLGTPTLFSYLDLLPRSNAVIFFPQTGSSFVRSKDFPNLIHFRASTDDETRALIRAMRHEYSASKFALLYQDDPFGKGPLNAALAELKRNGISDVLALPYTRGTVEFGSQVEEVKKYSPNALGFFATATATKEFIRQMGVNNVLYMNMFAISAVGEVQLRRFLKHKGLSILFASISPNPFMSDKPIAVAYRKAMAQENNILGLASFESYIGARLFLYALNQVPTPAPTPQEVLKVLEGMKNVNFEGIRLNFDPVTRSLAKSVFIERGEENLWLEYPLD